MMDQPENIFSSTINNLPARILRKSKYATKALVNASSVNTECNFACLLPAIAHFNNNQFWCNCLSLFFCLFESLATALQNSVIWSVYNPCVYKTRENEVVSTTFYLSNRPFANKSIVIRVFACIVSTVKR
jgi:hypothetical protein